MERITLLLVDDHAVVRSGLRAFLGLQADLEIVGEAADGAAAVDLARRLRPRVVLMDLVMPGTDGLTALRRLRLEAPDSRVLVLTSFTDDAQLFAAIEAGAAGYMLKDTDPDSLAAAVR